MFQSCYRGDVFTAISRITLYRTPAYCRRVVGQSRLRSFDIAGVRLGQLSDPRGANGIDDSPAVAHTCRRVGLNQTRLGEKIEVSIQAGPAYIHSSLQSPNGRRAEHRQVAQDIRPSAVAHKTYCHLNFGRQFWSNEAWHRSILPEAIENQWLFWGLTLSLINRPSPSLILWAA